MHIPQTQDRVKPSYHNSHAFLKKIDALPTQGAAWICDVVTSKGNQLNEDGEPLPTEKLELWRRDPVECVRELLGNPGLKNHMKYAPVQVYEDLEGNNRIFDEMWTADWWWNTQVNILFKIFSLCLP
jgi:Plavaka transposase